MVGGSVNPRPGIDGSSEWSRYGYATVTCMQSWVEPSPQWATRVTVQVRWSWSHWRPPGPDARAWFTAFLAALIRSGSDVDAGATAAARAPSAAPCETDCRKLSM